MLDILNASFEIQAMLVFGYFGYWIATVGLDAKLSTNDRMFQILAYGFVGWFIGKIAYQIFFGILHNDIVVWAQIIVMFISSVLSASLWRKYIRKWSTSFFSKVKVHTQDHHPSTIVSLINETNLTWNFVQVHLDNGTVLESDFTKLEGYPTDPLIIDPDGNVAMYITSIHRANKTPDKLNPNDEERGYKINYIPSKEIARIEICWRK